MHEEKRQVGNYQILRSLGKGGMGEVFLAHDPFCDRNVALKQIRAEWINNKTIQERFLREARVASQLSHPSIIAIYTINQDEQGIYYTMPYVEGETLKSILRTTREQEKKGELLHPIGASIPALIRIFLSIAEAVAYAHAHGIIHRDLKPENIIVGKYGEVIILDWGLANFLHSPDKDPSPNDSIEVVERDLTRPGAVAGTLTYLAPERAFGGISSTLTDIYSLGVILYQMLTLRLPFHRANLKEFRKRFKQEQILDPEEIAPDREISPLLSEIAKKCLAPAPEQRYKSVDELITDLDRYIEGLPEWTNAATLQIDKKEHWEFQENVLLARHIAITRQSDLMEWVSLMISKEAFTGNIRLETNIRLGETGKGIGFLLSIPPGQVGQGMIEGYCLWIGSSSHPGARLYRSNVQLMHFPEICLTKNQTQNLRIEMIDHHLRFYLGNKLKFNYLSHLPLSGNHIGLLFRDDDFNMEPLEVAVGSQNVMVNCLAVPGAFLSRKYFQDALDEYRRIAKSFPGRAEGREAIFRAGVTLLEEAQSKKKAGEKQRLFLSALDEFEKLHATPGAPLEYYGKSLVYKAMNDVDEEVKCLELAARKFPKHPLKPILVEHIITRMHESSRSDRVAAFHFALLALRHLPHIFTNPDHQMLLDTLKKHLEPLLFFAASDSQNLDTAIQLAFWLNRPLMLLEMIEKEISEIDRLNILYALVELNQISYVKEKYFLLSVEKNKLEMQKLLSSFKYVKKGNATLEFRSLVCFLFSLIDRHDTDLALSYFSRINSKDFSKKERRTLIEFHLWFLLLESHWEKAKELLNTFSKAELEEENHPLFFLYGCFLAATEGESAAVQHLTAISETAYPPTPLLLSHYLLGRIDWKRAWYQRTFYWEKIMLYRELILYFHCIHLPKMKTFLQKRLRNLLKNH